MSRKSGGRESQPERRFLGDVDADQFDGIAFEQVVTAFGEQVFGVFKEVRLVRDHPERAFVVHFFVRGAEKDHVTRERWSFALEQDHRHQVEQSLAFHVERATTVDRVVLDDGRKRIDFPRRWFRGYNVHVTQQDYRTLRAIAFETRDDVCPAGFVLEYLVFDAVLIEDLLQKPYCLDLVAGWI